MRLSVMSVTVILLFTLGCGPVAPLPETPAQTMSGYTYVPIDPMAVDREDSDSCKERKMSAGSFHLLDTLPDNAVRVSVEQFDSSGNVTFGVGNATVTGSRYRVTMDYINADTVPVHLLIRKEVKVKTAPLDGAPRKPAQAEIRREFVTVSAPPGDFIKGSERYEVVRITEEVIESSLRKNLKREELAQLDTREAREQRFLAGKSEERFEEFWLPTYIGVGLRVTSRVNVLQAGAEVSGLGSIGASAEAKSISGDLVVQTLGINGEAVTAALPIQSDLNQTTVMNAVVSVSSIKAVLRNDKTVTSPRLVGMYLPFTADQQLVNAVISALSAERVYWPQPCPSTPSAPPLGEGTNPFPSPT